MLDIKDRDLMTLSGIVKGPGYYPTPSMDRIKRMENNGLIVRRSGTLRPTIKGRIVNILRKLRTAGKN